MGTYASWVQQAVAAEPRPRRPAQVMRIARAIRRIAGGGSASSAAEPWDGRMPFLEPALRQARRRDRLAPPSRPRIVHLIGTLGPGGAERQMCNFVVSAHRRGHDIRVLLMWEPTGDHAHYYHLLTDAGVPVYVPGATFDPAFERELLDVPGGLAAVKQIPPSCWPITVDVLGELLVQKPQILHNWLDASNIWGGIAGVLARVPLIILSTRNVNPTHFPALALPYYRGAYAELLKNPAVRLVNNSHPGARDYASWLGIADDRVSVVWNGLDVSRLRPPSVAEVAAFRGRLQIHPQAPVVTGVFRLSEEKQPLVFLDVVRRLRDEHPDLAVVVAGIGPMEAAMREYVEAHRLPVHFLGRVDDVATVYAAASVTLLCSRQEGTPNVLLESQWLGCPVVATKAGGAVDVVDDGGTGFLVDVGDVDALRGAVDRLLRDAPLRQQMAQRGAAFIESRFSVERMVSDTLNLYGTVNGRRPGP